MTTEIRVVVETAAEKVFVSALDWPGWSRSGKKTTEAGKDAFLDYRDRYKAVVKDVKGVRFPGETATLSVEETQKGNGQTDFGVPGQVAKSEDTPISGKELDHQIAVLEATWAFFDDVSARVSAELRKGPRGGGRDRDEIRSHVLEAETGYATSVGLERAELPIDDTKAIAKHRKNVVAGLREYGPETGLGGKKWPVRYVIRRMAWHVLDHAWEMEDKDLTNEDAS